MSVLSWLQLVLKAEELEGFFHSFTLQIFTGPLLVLGTVTKVVHTQQAHPYLHGADLPVGTQ